MVPIENSLAITQSNLIHVTSYIDVYTRTPSHMNITKHKIIFEFTCSADLFLYFYFIYFIDELVISGHKYKVSTHLFIPRMYSV